MVFELLSTSFLFQLFFLGLGSVSLLFGVLFEQGLAEN